jgi:DNA-binding NarL/FixJ family response regulator
MPLLLLIEDHVVLGNLLVQLLENNAGVRVPVVLPTAEAALSYLAALQPAQLPDLVLIDLSLPGMNGVDLVIALRERYPALRCLMLSGHHESHYVARARAAGARGYVFKDDTMDIVQAVRRVLDGGVYFSEDKSK